MRLTILLGLWTGWRPIYDVTHVNALSRQLREYLKIPFQLVLLTDQEITGAEVDQVLPIPTDPENLFVRRQVNCFRRLRYFDPEWNKQFGTEWILSLDLDTLILGDITSIIEPALDHPFGFWILKSRLYKTIKDRPYNGALYMLRCGEHAHVWDDFDPQESPKEIMRGKWVGSDQAWISMQIKDAPTFGREQGVYFFGHYVQLRRVGQASNATMLNFAGHTKPWGKPCRFQAKDVHKEYMRWVA